MAFKSSCALASWGSAGEMASSAAGRKFAEALGRERARGAACP